LQGADADLQQALTLAPQDPSAVIAAARSAMERGQPAEAATLYEKLLREKPELPQAYLGLGEALLGNAVKHFSGCDSVGNPGQLSPCFVA
jgi:Tfp pilus assembly protein PilF